MKKVIMITYYFPPMGGGGIQRTLGFAKHLPFYNWQPVVLTAKSPQGFSLDQKVIKDISPNLKVYRASVWFSIFSNFLEKYHTDRDQNLFKRTFKLIGSIPLSLFCPGTFSGWIIPAIKQGGKIIKNNKIDLIYSTSPPFDSHIIAYFLKKKFNIPWVADFRDAYAGHPKYQIKSFKNNLRRPFLRLYENLVMHKVDCCVTATDPIKEDLLTRHSSKLRPLPVSIITNGFNETDFKDLRPYTRTDKFTITYTGSFQGDQTPECFIEAVKLLLEKFSQIRKWLKILFIGTFRKRDLDLFNQSSIGDVINVRNYTTYQEALQFQMKSDILLLIISTPIERGGSQVYTGKIFEYLRSQKPILAIVPEQGIAAQLIQKLGAGTVVNSQDIQGIVAAIKKLFDRWKENSLKVKFPLQDIQQFERKNLTRQLTGVFNKVSK